MIFFNFIDILTTMNEQKIEAQNEHQLSPQDQIGYLMEMVGKPGNNDSELSRLKELETIVRSKDSSSEEVAVAIEKAWNIYKEKLAGVAGWDGG